MFFVTYGNDSHLSRPLINFIKYSVFGSVPITRYRIKQTPAAAQRLQITPYVVASYTHHGSGFICSHLLPQFVWSSIPNRQNCGVPHYRDTTEKPEPILFAKILNQVAGLGRIHASQASCSFS